MNELFDRTTTLPRRFLTRETNNDVVVVVIVEMMSIKRTSHHCPESKRVEGNKTAERHPPSHAGHKDGRPLISSSIARERGVTLELF